MRLKNGARTRIIESVEELLAPGVQPTFRPRHSYVMLKGGFISCGLGRGRVDWPCSLGCVHIVCFGTAKVVYIL